MLTAPVHQQAPVAEVTIRLLEAPMAVYDLDVPLESFAADIRQYYAELAERIEHEREAVTPEDRLLV